MCDNVLVKALGHGDNGLLVVSECIPGNFFFSIEMVLLLLLLSRFSRIQLCATP